MKGFKAYNIEGAELSEMGQSLITGTYPIHFHLCHDTDTVSSPMVRNNAIHNSFSRCVTIHGSHGIMVIDNVAFDHVGHCFFLEDGGERRTYFEGNLGAGTKQGSLTPGDEQPTTFWITSPVTTMIGNVAAGSEKVGIWYLFPDKPVGPSRELGFFKNKEARLTPITLFKNNAAHSNEASGLNFNKRLGDNHTIIGCSTYNPRVDPSDKKSNLVPIVLDGFTGYKNRDRNVVMRSTSSELRNFFLSDSLIGIYFNRNMFGGYQQLTDSTIIGESPNWGVGGKIKYKDAQGVVHHYSSRRSLPHDNKGQKPLTGVSLNAEGPTHLVNVRFLNLKTNAMRKVIVMKV